uniref:Uncharacterized protein n=1 Tax=Anguilla anguilla TaxID=7936 RepID=A0A0E9RMV1_ANGAN
MKCTTKEIVCYKFSESQCLSNFLPHHRTDLLN